MKKIKLFIELIFIFILPIVLIACCFNVKKDYDVNGNEINRSLEFNNIFELNSESVNYIKGVERFSNQIEYLDENSNFNILFMYNNSYNILYCNVVCEDFQEFEMIIELGYIDFFGDEINFAYSDNDIEYQFHDSIFSIDDFIHDYYLYVNSNYLFNDEFWVSLNEYVGHEYGSYVSFIDVKYYDFDYYTISENAISKVINYLYSSLGIQENYILQIIVIYTLLWLIMWFIWHLIYLPLDFLSGILIRKVDYE